MLVVQSLSEAGGSLVVTVADIGLTGIVFTAENQERELSGAYDPATCHL